MKLSNSISVFFLLLFMVGCGDDEIVQRTRYTYIVGNASTFDLSVDVYQAVDGSRSNTFDISNDLVYDQDTILSQEWTVEDFLGGDSLVIRFSDGKELTYKCLSDGSGCDIDRNIFTSFSEPSTASTEEIRDVVRSYILTIEDYQRAE